jgi:sugar phosphate permease
VSASEPITAAPGVSARPFLGWRAVGAAFMAQLLSGGLTFSAFSVFVVPLSQAFETPQGQLGIALSIAFLVMGGLGPFIGRWLDRGLARRLMVSGTTIAGLGLMLLARAESLAQMAVVYCGIVAVGAALFGPTTSAALAANWFVRRRGLALGITVAGATVAGMVAPPAAAYLIDEVGWRGALMAFGGAALVIGLPVFAMVVGRPEDVGQAPDGDPPGHELGEAELASTDVGTSELVRDPNLWLLAVGFGLVFTSPIVMMLVLVPFGLDLGFSALEAAWFFTAMGPVSLLGKVVFGATADRIPTRLAIWMVVVGNVFVWALLHTNPDYPRFLAIGAFYGLAIGATGPLHGVVVGRCFGRAAFGRAMGIGGLAGLPLIAGAPTLSGYLYDTSGSYHLGFVVQCGVLLLGGASLSLLRMPQTDS